MAFQIAEAYVAISQRGAGGVSKAMTKVGADVQRAGGSLSALSVSSGKARFAMQNMMYAVEDAASVYGTQGLSGVLRATSNNITPILSMQLEQYRDTLKASADRM